MFFMRSNGMQELDLIIVAEAASKASWQINDLDYNFRRSVYRSWG